METVQATKGTCVETIGDRPSVNPPDPLLPESVDEVVARLSRAAGPAETDAMLADEAPETPRSTRDGDDDIPLSSRPPPPVIVSDSAGVRAPDAAAHALLAALATAERPWRDDKPGAGPDNRELRGERHTRLDRPCDGAAS